MAAAAILNFEKRMPLFHFATVFHELWWELCYDFEKQHIYDIGKRPAPKMTPFDCYLEI